ncbi:gp81 [Mycobacterium phage PLot]|uniref:Uncharacterized protein n=1 Tax=Mycobacterium phage PLot TaxID=373411 RepID=Q19Y68_9CAUD|nr:gp81 [Mycobacterium phage PLot]ABD58680.1 hypothetical protein PBI_PLOT_81 [Mycobacterium phage PLot]
MKLEDTHGGYAGKSLAEKMQDKLDSAYKAWRNAGGSDHRQNSQQGRHSRNFGRVEGCAAQLGILRSTSTKHEIEEAERRYHG